MDCPFCLDWWMKHKTLQPEQCWYISISCGTLDWMEIKYNTETTSGALSAPQTPRCSSHVEKGLFSCDRPVCSSGCGWIPNLNNQTHFGKGELRGLRLSVECDSLVLLLQMSSSARRVGPSFRGTATCTSRTERRGWTPSSAAGTWTPTWSASSHQRSNTLSTVSGSCGVCLTKLVSSVPIHLAMLC